MQMRDSPEPVEIDKAIIYLREHPDDPQAKARVTALAQAQVDQFYDRQAEMFLNRVRRFGAVESRAAAVRGR